MFQTPPFLDFNLNLNLNNNLRISIIQQFIVVKMVFFIEFIIYSAFNGGHNFLYMMQSFYGARHYYY